jgi:hypothetical protein
VVAILLYTVRYALLPFVFAAAIGFVTDPVVRAAQRRLGGPRWVSATLILSSHCSGLRKNAVSCATRGVIARSRATIARASSIRPVWA